MGRPRKDRRLDTVKNKLLDKIVEEQEADRLVDFLVAYFRLIDVMEREKQIKDKHKIKTK